MFDTDPDTVTIGRVETYREQDARYLGIPVDDIPEDYDTAWLVLAMWEKMDREMNARPMADLSPDFCPVRHEQHHA